MTDTRRPSLLVLGGNSDIGIAIAREYAAHGHDIILAARQSGRLHPFIADFSIRYQSRVTLIEFDVTAYDTHAAFLSKLSTLPDDVVCAVGMMHDQAAAERDPALVSAMIGANYIGPVSILEQFASAFAKRGSGRIIGLSSIAGVRGRASNYLYGSTKAAFTVYLEGLQHRLKKSGVRVEIIKPGFVKTRMTAALDLPASLLVDPADLAKLIYHAKLDRREIIPGFKWFLIANLVRHLPNFLFLRTRL